MFQQVLQELKTKHVLKQQKKRQALQNLHFLLLN